MSSSALAGMPQQKLHKALEQLASAELIFRRGTPPDAEYTFKHALVQDVAYSTLLRSRRQQIHARIASTMESEFPEIVASQPQLMAQHCAEAGLAEKAVDYWLKAGKQALRSSALKEAETHIRKGLNLLSSLPDRTDRNQREFDLQQVLVRAQAATQGYSSLAVGEILTRARQLWEQLGEPPSSTLLVSQFEYHLHRAELALAHRDVEATQHLGECRNDRYWKVLGCNMRAALSFWLGEFSAAGDFADKSLRLYDSAGVSPSVYGKTVALTYSALSSFHLGHIHQARARSAEAVATAGTDAFSLALALDYALFLQLEATTLLRRSAELKAHCVEHGQLEREHFADGHSGWALLALRRTEEGLAVLAQALDNLSARGVALRRPFLQTLLADGLGKTAKPTEGLERLDNAMREIELSGERWAESNLHRIRGELLTAVGDLSTAESSFHQAIGVAHQQNAKFWELRAAISLARLWRDQGKRHQAHDLLASVYGWFTEGFDTPVLKDAKALLDELA
jgi:tetratricopeptide (TPR) repeat protein